MKLNAKALGLALGIMWAIVLFLATIVILAKGTGGEHLKLLGKFYPGYSVSAVGLILALIWGFISAFIFGWLVGLLYNAFSKAPKPTTTPIP